MTFIPNQDVELEILKGSYSGHAILRAFGYREGMATTAAGEDIWPGTATTIPQPVDAGEQLEIVSDDAADDDGSTGVEKVTVEYLDATGAEQTEEVTLNGTGAVALTETNVRFVNDMYSSSVGSGGVAAGDITLYKQGAASTIYNMIAEGGNKSMVPNRMVPLAKTLYLKRWHAEEAQGKRCSFRIRSTDMGGTILPGVFCFKDVAYLNKNTSGPLDVLAAVPALSVVKISGWPDAAGAEGSCGYWGILVDDPVPA